MYNFACYRGCANYNGTCTKTFWHDKRLNSYFTLKEIKKNKKLHCYN